MTISRAWAIGIGVVLGLAIVLGGFELLQEHDARLKSEGVQSAQEQIIKSNQSAIDQARSDMAKTGDNLKAQLATIAGQRTIIVTPQQAAAAIPAIIPNLPQPVTVQAAPAAAGARASESLVIPEADIPAFQKYKLDCDESNAKLTACTLNAASASVIQKSTDSDLAAMTAERDSWRSTAKGGTFWHRFGHDAIQIGVTAGVAYAVGRLQK